MRCVSYATAYAFQFRDLITFLKDRYRPTVYRDVIHVAYDEDMSDVFYFSYGVIVMWGASEAREKIVLEEIKAFETKRLSSAEVDQFDYSYGSTSQVYRNHFSLQTRSVLTKLAISYGIAQSIKLTVFENAIDKTLSSTTTLAEELARKGKISLSRKEISQKIGLLLMERNSVNIHSDMLDTPEFFWEYDELVPLYDSTAHYLDIKNRTDVLNKRLDIVKELLEMLSDELKHKHSSVLEMVIIVLIMLEVVMSLYFHFFK